MADPGPRYLAEPVKRVLRLSTWTICHANQIREGDAGLKIVSHEASSVHVRMPGRRN